jgi:hypothetical protein
VRGIRSGYRRALAAGALASGAVLVALVTSAAAASTVQVNPSAAKPTSAAVPLVKASQSGRTAWRPACPAASPREERCFAWYAPQTSVNAALADGQPAKPTGWGARSLESAYKLPVSADSSSTVAVVDAFSTPKLAAEVAAYRHQYGLPACTTASGCLRIVNQAGKASPLPPSGVPYGWDVETSLDVEMVSAACPTCHILVVEAKDPEISDLAAAQDTAVKLGAQVVSNSYGAQESGYSQTFAGDYDHPGHTIVAASGDYDFGVANFPANQASVIAVGGTELRRADNARGWSETVWNTDEVAGTASGCSAYVTKPAWQHDSHCLMRTLNDVSAVAAGVPVYDVSQGGWLTIAGTSIAAPLIAGVYGLAGNGATTSPALLYAHATDLFDVTSGSNVAVFLKTVIGPVCGGDYLCTAKRGYDAPTGLGTPDGIGAF